MENLSPAQLAELNTLKVKLQGIAPKINAIVDQGRLIENNPNELFLFKGMYKELKPYFDAFNNCWDNIIEFFFGVGLSNVFPSQQDKQLQQAVERYYYESCAIYERHMNPTPVVQAVVNPAVDEAVRNPVLNETRLVRARLPQINLPQFNGHQADWPIFHDTYKSLIHDEASLSDIEKFHFLITSLKGPALSLIKGINLQEENYEQAWNLLTEQYNNKRRLANSYLKTVLEFKPFTSRPTASSLKHLLTTVVESIESFKHLAIPQAGDFILSFLLLRCLDPQTRRAFERKYAEVEIPTYQNLQDFLRVEWRSMDLTSEESDRHTSHCGNPNNHGRSQPRNQFKSSLLVNFNKGQCHNYNNSNNGAFKKQDKRSYKVGMIKCPACKAEHTLYQCDKFRNSTAVERLSLLRNWCGCTNCLSSKHSVDKCPSMRRCQHCNQCHHTWLHQPTPELRDRQPVVTPSTSQANGGIALGSISRQGEVLLGTAMIGIQNAQGEYKPVRIVTDSGSQYSFITHDLVKMLSLTLEPCSQNIFGIGQLPFQNTLGKIRCNIQSLFPSLASSTLTTEAIVVPIITGNLPQAKLPSLTNTYYSSYVLADPQFCNPGPVDFLLGADLYFDIITGRPITVKEEIPRLLPTMFGCIVGGQMKSLPRSNECSSFLVQSSEELQDVMAKFWETEEVSHVNVVSEEDELCEKHYQSTHYRLDSGRYMVSIPFKDSISSLENPRNQAFSRLMNLEAKLSKCDTLRLEYHNFMKEYLELGHMELSPSTQASYTLPHHAVTKWHEGRMKLRTVFDASCSSSTGSLNDHMLTGPKLQLDISDIISSFRTHLIAFTADIVKMYRQILIHPPDRRYQHILWRFHPSEKIDAYELRTITYGLKSAPFLALRTIQQLVQDEGSSYPLASKALLSDIYVDDIATGGSTEEEALQLRDELINLLAKGGFELSKWASNSPRLVQEVDKSQKESSSVTLSIEDEPKVKLLGMQWNPKLDVFAYEIRTPSLLSSKRAILSAIARIYDPLGFLSSVVFYAKTILQEMWISKCGWDDIGPPHITSKWQSFLSQIHMLSEVQVPRCIISGKEESFKIVGFCDASQKGFSAVIYLVSKTPSGTHVNIIKGKTKLAPIKPMTIPRLELSGALLLARLYKSCSGLIHQLGCTVVNLFTDSQVVLGWLSTPPQKLKTFVAHRVIKVLEITANAQWAYVSSNDNPADCSSRGILPSELCQHPLWWAGPAWLKGRSWPSSSVAINDLPELKGEVSTALTAIERQYSPIKDCIERFSSYTRLLHCIAYILRFIKRLKNQQSEQGPLKVNELREANKTCVRNVQSCYKKDGAIDWQKLKNAKPLHSLTPFIDKDGIIRVGGRLNYSHLSYDVKHPIIIPGNSHFAKLLVDHYHLTYLHLGPIALQSMLQCRYWITSARKLIRQRVFNCIRCYKVTQRPQPPIMGNLPSYRLEEGLVFQHVGVDFGGPFSIRESLRRKAAVGKAYLCLFICMSTRAVHLEVVSKCSTDAFLAAFERFIARRGKPVQMYSDCGTNFIGAANKLREIFLWLRSNQTQEDIIDHASNQEIKWSFNPPSSPHFGGIWEAGIKSAKAVIQKVTQDIPLTFEELSTLFCRIEGILNSRPLIPQDSNPECIESLTPGHFLIGKPITALTEENLTEQNISLLKRWHLIQQQAQHFWTRWRLEYLNHLQQRKKWKFNRENLKIGDLVIIKEPNAPQRSWPMARVVETHPGKDEIVRVVSIRTLTGIFKRPVAKLVPLTPLNTEN